MPLTLPLGPLANDAAANFDDMLAIFTAIQAKFNAGVVDADCSVTMDLDAAKLSSTAGKRIPEPKYENNSVSARALAADTANPGSDAIRAVSGDHIKTITVAHAQRIIPSLALLGSMLVDGTLTRAKYLAQSISQDKIEMARQTQAFAISNVAAAVVNASNQQLNFNGLVTTAAYDVIAVGLDAIVTFGGRPLALTVSRDVNGANHAVRVQCAGGAADVTAPGAVNFAYGAWSVSGTAFMYYIRKT